MKKLLLSLAFLSVLSGCWKRCCKKDVCETKQTCVEQEKPATIVKQVRQSGPMADKSTAWAKEDYK